MEILISVLVFNNLVLLIFIEKVRQQVVSYYPVNHWGGDVRWGLIFCLINIVACGIMMYAGKKAPYAFVGIVLTVIVAISLVLVDHFNVLVEYHRWLQRGMPTFGERS